MPETITACKIAATPTTLAWSQAYSAGSLYIVLSLSHTNAAGEEKSVLSATGKELLSAIEAEYFTLEEKTLFSIKSALESTLRSLPKDISLSLAAASIHTSPEPGRRNNIAYVYLFDYGAIRMKRDKSVGNLLSQTEGKEKNLICASGFLQSEDVLCLQTKQFLDTFPQKELDASLLHASIHEAAEMISPKIHEKEEGGAAAILIQCNAPQTKQTEEAEETTEGKQDAHKPQQSNYPKFPQLPIHIVHEALAKWGLSLPYRSRFFLFAALGLVVLLIVSVYFFITKQQDAKNQALFQNAYSQAQKKYDEGISLATLNKNLARDDFEEAQNLLKNAKDKLPASSEEAKDIQELLKKVEQALVGVSSEFAIDAKEASASDSPLLAAVTKQNSTIAYALGENKIYLLTKDAIETVDPKIKKPQTSLKNNDIWKDPVGLGLFGNNLYVLDKKAKQIFKFSGNNKTNYLTNEANIDFTNAVSLTNDASLYVLFSDGTIAKFTRGKPEAFNIKDLDKSLTNPTRIFTNEDTDSIYVLDNGNKRLVVLEKNGTYKAQYQTDLFKNAKAMEVREQDKKVYFLSGDKIYSIDLK